mgnify:CR=1 FL=1
MKKHCLIEIQYEDDETSPQELRKTIDRLETVYEAKIYINKEKLCVDVSSKQCLYCPAYFVQEAI